MKRLILLMATAAAPLAGVAQPISSGNYRIPYASGIQMTVLVDHVTHVLSNRVDLKGIDIATNNYAIVAAADGVVRAIRDSNNAGCATCTNNNNYVWIEHSNGEWTGYFYLRQNSVSGAANLAVNDAVASGQFLGFEGSAGSTPNARLRFEVGVPANDNDPIVAGTGALKGENRLPAICNITDNILRAGRSYDPRSCFAQEFSYAVYRFPYSNNVQFRVSQDHLTHAPVKTRLDLVANGGTSAPYPVVAAAAGTIMSIVDNNTTNCGSCSAFNNYVWIAHANGEWTKYTHFVPGTVRNNAGLKVGDVVAAGTYLGDEGNIGAASGVHLHFEVGFPFDVDSGPIDPSGGFLTNGVNRIPIFCGISGNIARDGDVFTAGPCSGDDCTEDITLSPGTIRGTRAFVASATVDSNNSALRVDTYGSLALMAGQKITLRPGFHAVVNSYVRASIRPCNAPP